MFDDIVWALKFGWCGEIFAPADLLGLSWPLKSRRLGQEILVAKFLGEVAERLKATVLPRDEPEAHTWPRLRVSASRGKPLYRILDFSERWLSG